MSQEINHIYHDVLQLDVAFFPEWSWRWGSYKVEDFQNGLTEWFQQCSSEESKGGGNQVVTQLLEQGCVHIAFIFYY